MTPTPTRLATRRLSLTALLTLSTSIALAADWPTFKPGNWTFDRTETVSGSTPETVSRTECTDPTADEKAEQAMLAKAGAQFTPLEQIGTIYRYSMTYKKAGITAKSESVLTVDSAEAYTITADSTVDGVTVDGVTTDGVTIDGLKPAQAHEVLRARRIGDCAK